MSTLSCAQPRFSIDRPDFRCNPSLWRAVHTSKKRLHINLLTGQRVVYNLSSRMESVSFAMRSLRRTNGRESFGSACWCSALLHKTQTLVRGSYFWVAWRHSNGFKCWPAAQRSVDWAPKSCVCNCTRRHYFETIRIILRANGLFILPRSCKNRSFPRKNFHTPHQQKETDDKSANKPCEDCFVSTWKLFNKFCILSGRWPVSITAPYKSVEKSLNIVCNQTHCWAHENEKNQPKRHSKNVPKNVCPEPCCTECVWCAKRRKKTIEKSTAIQQNGADHPHSSRQLSQRTRIAARTHRNTANIRRILGLCSRLFFVVHSGRLNILTKYDIIPEEAHQKNNENHTRDGLRRHPLAVFRPIVGITI